MLDSHLRNYTAKHANTNNMTMPNPQKAKTQREKFEEAARELETDDSEEAFDAKLKKVTKAPPQSVKERPSKPPRT